MSNVTTIIDVAGPSELEIQSLLSPDEPFNAELGAIRFAVAQHGATLEVELTASEAARLIAALSQVLADSVR